MGSLSLTIKEWIGVALEPEALMLQYSTTGSKSCLRKLVEHCSDDLFYYLVGLSNHELAKDISQLTWLKVIEKRAAYRDSGKFKTWLFTLGRHALIDELRRQNRQPLVDDATHAEERVLAPLVDNDCDEAALLEQALAHLAFVQREAIVLQLEGFSISEIAKITAEQNETIKSRLRYARQHLKTLLGDHHER